MEIIFQDKDLIVINKPGGVVVNRAQSVTETTLQDWFADNFSQYLIDNSKSWGEWQSLVPDDFQPDYGTPEEIFAQRMGMVHRLDKDTSGVLLWAKNPGSLVNLLAQFQKRRVEKTYQCLVHGVFNIDQDMISLPIARSSSDGRKFAISFEGRQAVTKYQVISQYQLSLELRKKLSKQAKIYQSGFSFLKCWPKTGRTHQIRVHMQATGHPIVGDTKYVGRKKSKLDPTWCPRQFLHASSIKLVHPRSGREIEFEAKLADDLQEVVSNLVIKESAFHRQS